MRFRPFALRSWCVLAARRAGAIAGDARTVLPRQDDQHLCRIAGRRRLRHLRAAGGAATRQAHPGPADHRGAEHAGRWQQQGGELHLQRGAQGRHRDRRDLPRRDAATTARRYAGPARAQQVHLCRQRQQRGLSLRWRADAPAKTFREAQQKEIIVGASREGGTTRDLPPCSTILRAANSRWSPATPAAGKSGSRWSATRCMPPAAWAATVSRPYPHGSEKIVTMTLQLSLKGHAELNTMGVPLATQFATSKENRQAMELVLSQGVFGRPFVLPPDVPPERSGMRKAFTPRWRTRTHRRRAEDEARYRGAVRRRPSGQGRGAIRVAAGHGVAGQTVDDLQANEASGGSLCGGRARLHRRRIPRGQHAFAQDRSSNSTGVRRSTSYRLEPGRRLRCLCRALGRHMGKYIPGNPTIVPQNMPGAGGNKAAG